MDHMTNDQIENFLSQAAKAEITAREAIALLVAGGFAADDAEQAVFTALGGSDVIEVGADNIERYDPSRRAVTEVAAAMDR